MRPLGSSPTQSSHIILCLLGSLRDVSLGTQQAEKAAGATECSLSPLGFALRAILAPSVARKLNVLKKWTLGSVMLFWCTLTACDLVLSWIGVGNVKGTRFSSQVSGSCMWSLYWPTFWKLAHSLLASILDIPLKIPWLKSLHNFCKWFLCFQTRWRTSTTSGGILTVSIDNPGAIISPVWVFK